MSAADEGSVAERAFDFLSELWLADLQSSTADAQHDASTDRIASAREIDREQTVTRELSLLATRAANGRGGGGGCMPITEMIGEIFCCFADGGELLARYEVGEAVAMLRLALFRGGMQ